MDGHQTEAAGLPALWDFTARTVSPEARSPLPENGHEPTVTPHPYQEEAITFLAGRNGLLADDCGLGKTLCAVLSTNHDSGPILVVCPKRSKTWWEQQIELLAPGSDYVMTVGDAGRLPGNTSVWAIAAEPGARLWVICHYEGVRMMWQDFSQEEWGCIILDEAHRIRNRQTQTAVKLKRLKATHRIALTATPMERLLAADAWSILNWLDKDTFHSYWKFFDRYINYRHNMFGGYEIRGLQPDTKDELAQLLSKYMLRRTKLEVAPQLPPRIHTTVPLEMGQQQRALYKQVCKEIEIDLAPFADKDGPTGGRAASVPQPAAVALPSLLFIKGILARIIRMQQVTSDPRLLGVETGSVKYEWLEEWLRDRPNEIVVIMTQFRDTAIRLAKQFDGACVVGGMPVTEAERFLSGGTRLLCGTIAAAGESLNLQRASTLIFMEQVWSATKMRQAVDRIHRIDITEPKHIITLQCQHSVDLLIDKALKGKLSDGELVFELIKNRQDYL